MDQKVINMDQEQEETNSNIVDFMKAKAGRPPPPGDWLMGLKEGTIFLCKPVLQFPGSFGFELMEYHIIAKATRSVELLVNITPKDTYHWVDSLAFSAKMQLFEILREGD